VADEGAEPIPEGMTDRMAHRWWLARQWRVTVSAVVGRTRLPLSEVMALRKGSVLALNEPTAQPLDMEAGGRRLFTGHVFRSGDRYALKIVEGVD